MANRTAAIRDYLAGPDVVVSFLFLILFSFITFTVSFPPAQVPGYLLIIAFGSGAATVIGWLVLAVVAGVSSQFLRTRFGEGEWDSFGDAVYPLATSLAVVGLVAIGFGVRPMVMPYETAVTTCTSGGCETAVGLLNDPNIFVIVIGLILLVLGAAMALFKSPLVANGRDESTS